MFTYGKHYVDKKDVNEVIKSLKGNLLTTGEYVDFLEKKIKKKFYAKNVICCNSGTSAIFLSLVAINIKKGDNVIIPSINFTAAASSCSILGANIFFADVDPKTFQLSKKSLQECIKKYKIRKIKAVFSMHLGGSSRHQKEIYLLKKKHGFFLIEDACHALGGKYSKTKFLVGSCKYSDITTFSLHPVKTITSGEGGLICTNNNKIAEKIKILRSHGITNRNKYIYDIKKCSFNFRLSDINCALASSQLDKTKKFIKKRRQLVKRYSKNFNKYPNLIEIINIDDFKYSAWHLMIVKVNVENFDKEKFYDLLLNYKIKSQLHYIPTYRLSTFKKNNSINFKRTNLNSEIYFKKCISLPLYFKLKLKDVDFISNIVLKILLKI